MRSVFAFSLLEALTLVVLDVMIKGGTCLMLLLDAPKRLSTDIDIIVAPGTDIEVFLKEAAEVFPFIGREEQTRYTSRKIEKAENAGQTSVKQLIQYHF